MENVIKEVESFNSDVLKSENILKLLLTLKKQYPNDMEFGREVRKVLNKLNND